MKSARAGGRRKEDGEEDRRVRCVERREGAVESATRGRGRRRAEESGSKVGSKSTNVKGTEEQFRFS